MCHCCRIDCTKCYPTLFVKEQSNVKHLEEKYEITTWCSPQTIDDNASYDTNVIVGIIVGSFPVKILKTYYETYGDDEEICFEKAFTREYEVIAVKPCSSIIIDDNSSCDDRPSSLKDINQNIPELVDWCSKHRNTISKYRNIGYSFFVLYRGCPCIVMETEPKIQIGYSKSKIPKLEAWGGKKTEL